MTKEEIITLFPCEVEVTEDILSNTNISDYNNCTGALILKSILPEELRKDVRWSNNTGKILLGDTDYVSISSRDPLDNESRHDAY